MYRILVFHLILQILSCNLHDLLFLQFILLCIICETIKFNLILVQFRLIINQFLYFYINQQQATLHIMTTIQAFLSQQPIDKLLLSYFSATNHIQLTSLNNLILFKVVQIQNPLQYLYKECKYVLQVNNNDKQPTLKLAVLLHHVIGKSSSVVKSASFQTLLQILQFCLSKVFITICSNQYIMLMGVIIITYEHVWSMSKGKNSQKSELSHKISTKFCQQSKKINQNQNANSSNKSENGCCSNIKCNEKCSETKTKLQSNQKLLQNHQKLAKFIIQLLNNTKMHVGSYKQSIRHVLYKLLLYVLNVTQFGQNQLSKIIIQQTQMKEQQKKQINPFFMNLGVSKAQLIELVLRCAESQKDPRNIAMVFTSYKTILKLFKTEIQKLDYKSRIYENLEAYYPIDMVGDEDNQDHQSVNLLQIKNRLEECLLDDFFKEEVREMLIDKMMSPPVNSYIGLYSLYISKYNPSNTLLTDKNTKQSDEKKTKYDIMTLNLLLRLTQEEYLNESGQEVYEESISYLVKTILLNVFRSRRGYTDTCNDSYSACRYEVLSKFTTFLSQLLVAKLLNFKQNNKFAGTILAIVKDIFNSGQNSCQSVKNCPSFSKINFKQILLNFIIYKFMQNWSANGDLAFKMGLLIVGLNYQLSSKTWNQAQNIQQNNGQNLELLLLTLGNIYQQNRLNQSGQIQIMVMKSLMILKSVFQKQSPTHSSLNRIKILNNGIIHKDCLQVAKILNKDRLTQQKLQSTEFENKDPIFLKCYIDYILAIYVHQYPLISSLGSINIDMGNSTNEFQKESDNKNRLKAQLKLEDVSPFEEVKLYMMIGYLAIQAERMYKYHGEAQTLKFDRKEASTTDDTSEFSLLIISQNEQQILSKICKTLSHILSYKQTFGKVYRLLQSYPFPILIRIFGIIFSLVQQSDILHTKRIESTNLVFVNLTKIANLLSQKHSSYYQVQLMTKDNIWLSEHVLKHLQLQLFKSRKYQFVQLIGIYLMKKLWVTFINEVKVKEQNQDNSIRSLIQFIKGKIFSNKKQNFQQQIKKQATSQLQTLIRQRLGVYFLIMSQQSVLLRTNQLNFTQVEDSLHFISRNNNSSVKTVNHQTQMKQQNIEVKCQFNKKLIQIYNPCVLEHYWNEMIKMIQYNQKKTTAETETEIHSEKKLQQQSKMTIKIVEMVEFLPEKMLIASAQYILPILIKQPTQTQSKNIKKLNFYHIKTVSKIVSNLTQNLLLQQILPYSLQFLELLNRKEVMIEEAQPIQSILSNTKILHQLKKITEDKTFQNLRKMLIKQKLNIKKLLQKQLFSKKRAIRQSTRNIITQYEQMMQ